MVLWQKNLKPHSKSINFTILCTPTFKFESSAVEICARGMLCCFSRSLDVCDMHKELAEIQVGPHLKIKLCLRVSPVKSM